jgi:CRISPR-associated protein Cmr3
MTWWTFDPHDPLMVRDGRPFGLDTDGACSMAFPPPSVVAGAMRTRVGFAGGRAVFGLTPQAARAIPVVGPLLAKRDHRGGVGFFGAAPRDVVLFERTGDGWPRRRLAPLPAWTDGAHGHPGGMLVVGNPDLPPDKPAKDAPAFWSFELLRAWLEAPPASDVLRRAGTVPPLPHERRVHVAIDAKTGTGEDGKLFQTDGLRLRDGSEGWGSELTLAVACEDPALTAGMVPLGGERRLAALSRLPAGPDWPAIRPGTRRLRVLLLTPGLFANGAWPAKIEGAPVVAAAVDRPLVISGWDLARGCVKQVRRCAPAGSVYWVDVPEPLDVDAWVARVHLNPISDDEQDRRDGFGLAVVGVA